MYLCQPTHVQWEGKCTDLICRHESHERNMLKSLPIILFSNSQKPTCSLLSLQFLPLFSSFCLLCSYYMYMYMYVKLMKPHTAVQQKAMAIPHQYLCWMSLGCWNLSYENYTPPLVHAYHVVPAPISLHCSFTPLTLFRNYARSSCIPIMVEIVPAYCAQAYMRLTPTTCTV